MQNCHYNYFYFLCGIQLLKQENKYYIANLYRLHRYQKIIYRIEHGNLHKTDWKHPILNHFEFWSLDAIQCHIRFCFQTCLNKRSLMSLFVDETWVRHTEFMPGNVTLEIKCNVR